MQGLRAIHQLNNQRAFEAVLAAEGKAQKARQQNHPNAAEIEAHARALRKDYEGTPH